MREKRIYKARHLKYKTEEERKAVRYEAVKRHRARHPEKYKKN